ncbi:MAG TPA: tetratricopeptide repeat protein [Micropepsaceae bacterium]|jgi:TolB-like protein/Tfp pilus assembly protein PilF
MDDFFAALRDRHVYRVAAAYVVVAWILLQLYNNLQPILKLADWVGTLVLVVLVTGFPVSLLLAWVYQITPNSGAWLSQRSAKTPPLFQPKSTGGISIAVLPLANLSGDSTQEFFSDGMTDEITSALAKIRDLRVVGRSSAFQFKGQYKDLRAIGRALSARYLIEGSVRKAGDRVRITAQLAEAESGSQRWSETYDRELKDVFAVQEDIAHAIAAALHVSLGLKRGESLVPSRTSHLDSYQDYLRAKALVRARGPRESGGPLTEAAKLLEQAVARAPNYAPAWAVLAQAYSLIPAFSPPPTGGSIAEYRSRIMESLTKAETSAQRAIRLDPSHAEGYIGLATVHTFRRQFIPAEDLFQKALSLDPNNPDALQIYSVALATAGRIKDALPLRLRLRALEPFVPVFNAFTAQILWLNGQDDAAIAILKALPRNTAFAAISLAQIHAAAGRYGEAADALLEAAPGFYRPGAVEIAAGLLRTAPVHAVSVESLPKLGPLSFVYLYAGAPERALEPAEDGDPDAPTAMLLWHPSAAAARKTVRFKTLVHGTGMVEFWRARGWPDLCRAQGPDDFVCD